MGRQMAIDSTVIAVIADLLVLYFVYAKAVSALGELR